MGNYAAHDAAAAVHGKHGRAEVELPLPPLVMHVCGKFHCEGGLGIPEHLARYQRLRDLESERCDEAAGSVQLVEEGSQAQQVLVPPAPRVVTVVFFPEPDYRTFVAEHHTGLADYIVLTNEAVPPSFQVNHPL